MAVFDFSALFQCLVSQEPNEIGEFYIIVASFYTHITTDAGPYCIADRATTIQSQHLLYYTAGIKLCIVTSHRTNHGAFTTIQAEAHPGIAYDAL
jgi:hypothetical protein